MKYSIVTFVPCFLTHLDIFAFLLKYREGIFSVYICDLVCTLNKYENVNLFKKTYCSHMHQTNSKICLRSSEKKQVWFSKHCFHWDLDYSLLFSRSVMSDTLWPHELLPTRLLYPWGFLGKNTGVGCHFLLQGYLPDPGI